ncbi:unnamed protein product [Vitrella brassicaformis CCMP3155]|uniref:Uncharacterized protein n=1 Tax=Vitrella brassicaformis (strain CCMP3155) TaxID=1169540 RepID=A0A0G4FYZ8_VITBC|nr:unnamed protein product [Vitrella brassicaformis CCMP3155]|eukprot:CEM20845.1 unnamed protein product [Vitrella brassicaformis CCMP3155]
MASPETPISAEVGSEAVPSTKRRQHSVGYRVAKIVVEFRGPPSNDMDIDDIVSEEPREATGVSRVTSAASKKNSKSSKAIVAQHTTRDTTMHHQRLGNREVRAELTAQSVGVHRRQSIYGPPGDRRPEHLTIPHTAGEPFAALSQHGCGYGYGSTSLATREPLKLPDPLFGPPA